jgi:hypothetical protein
MMNPKQEREFERQYLVETTVRIHELFLFTKKERRTVLSYRLEKKLREIADSLELPVDDPPLPLTGRDKYLVEGAIRAATFLWTRRLR